MSAVARSFRVASARLKPRATYVENELARGAVAEGGTVLIPRANECRSKERFESMNVRIGTKVTVCVDDSGGERAADRTKIDGSEMR
jgi:hypothetical protein